MDSLNSLTPKLAQGGTPLCSVALQKWKAATGGASQQGVSVH
jgi:hypothetical protein